MYTYRKVQVESTQVSSITCNKCGRVVQFGEFDFQVEVSFTEIKHVYGYGSPKDGDKYLSHVCEACMDAFYATFTIPPQIAGMVVWGEEPADPIVLAGESSDTPT
jgi:hypothetical protein